MGDPIVNITFGESRNDSAANFAPGTSYIYTPFDCPLDGSYTITNTNISCFDTAWHVITDHTGNGNFMLVNASFPPGDFFVTTVTNLCPNTTYEFAAWIINLLINNDGSNPNITFSIETTDSIVLKQFKYKRYKFYP